MSTSLEPAELSAPVVPGITEPPYRAILETVLAFYGSAPATPETSRVRATRFVASLAGCVGHYDEELGARIFAVVQPPAPAAGGAA